MSSEQRLNKGEQKMYRILIADDEGLMLEAFKGVILAEFGDKCSVETAKTGRAVIEKAETFHPDIVFMDIHMPGINGIQPCGKSGSSTIPPCFMWFPHMTNLITLKKPLILVWNSILRNRFRKSKIILWWKKRQQRWIRFVIREVIC